MSRLARIVIPGVPHHIVQRGNNCQDVFFVDDDRQAYLSFLRERAEEYGLEILGYCLMTNHIHLVARPRDSESLAKGVGRTHFRYTQYINRRHGRSGHLWEGRFHSCALDKPHFWAAMRYVEQNPVRAKIERNAWDYTWSSAAAHIGGKDASALLDISAWHKIMTAADWRKLLRRRVTRDDTKALQHSTHRGWPLATDKAVSKFERLLGRRLRPLPIGRPQAVKKKAPRKRKNRRTRK